MLPIDELLSQASTPTPPPPEPASPLARGSYTDIHDEDEWERRWLTGGQGGSPLVCFPGEAPSSRLTDDFTGFEDLPNLTVTERVRSAQERLKREYQAREQAGGML